MIAPGKKQIDDRFRLFYESSKDAIMTIEPPGWRFTSGNLSAVKLFGVGSEKDFVKYAPWQLSPEYQSDGRKSSGKAKEMIETAILNGSNFFEWRHRDLSGKEFFASVLLTKMEREEGPVLQATVRNIERQKQIENELRESEKKFRLLAESLPLAVFLMDENNKLIYTNSIWDRIFEIHLPEELIENWHDFIHPDEKEKIISDWNESKENQNTSYSSKFRIISANKRIKWVSASMSVLMTDDGIFLTGTMEDITEQKEAEIRLKNAEFQLMQSEKMAGIGQLAAGVAHEINNPVGFISSNMCTLEKYLLKISEMIFVYRKYSDSEEVRDRERQLKIDFILEDIIGLIKENKDGLGRVIEIVKNLKNFSRIDSVDKYEETDINQIIKDTLNVARNEIKYVADVKTHFSDIEKPLCNTGEISQVFLNLTVNAAQAIKSDKKEEKGEILIKTYQNNENVFCEFSDNGPGIPDYVLVRIFEPFFTTKEVGAGTGLGLSISYDIIVNKHKGNIVVESRAKHGTKFTVSIPKKRAFPYE